MIGAFVADNCVVEQQMQRLWCARASVIHHSRQFMGTLSAWMNSGPVLEDDVFIGWGSVIVGPLTIPSGTRIPPNAMVTAKTLRSFLK